MRDVEEHFAVAVPTTLFEFRNICSRINSMNSHPVPRELEGAVAGPGDGLGISMDFLLEVASFGASKPITQGVKFGLRHDLVLSVVHSDPLLCATERGTIPSSLGVDPMECHPCLQQG